MTDKVDFVQPPMPNTVRTTHLPVISTRLGDRVRQLRVSAGLTQTDLAGTRFSKEYVSQIERGKTRPTRETIEWLAQRPASTPTSCKTVSRPTSAAGSRPCSPALRHWPMRTSVKRRSSRSTTRVPLLVTGLPSSRFGSCQSRRGHARTRRGSRRDRASRPGADARRGPGLLGRRPRGHSVPPRRLPVQAFEHRHGRRPVRRGASARGALGPSVRSSALGGSLDGMGE